MNSINECVLQLYFLFFDVVLGTFGPLLRLYESAGRSFNYYFYLIIFLGCGAYLMTFNLNYISYMQCSGPSAPRFVLPYDC